MPIPTPNSGETRKEFVRRCMSNKTMINEYGAEQRFAICVSEWDDKDLEK